MQPDAGLAGNVTAGVERDAKEKCITYKDIDVDCWTRTIDFRAQVRATRFADGRTICAESFPNRKEQTVCFGDDQDFASSESVIRSIIAETADAIRDDLAPREYHQEIRILESRKGMSKADANLFKAAIRMTKTDAAEACRMWDEAAANGLVHISLQFNRGLCAEQRGDLEEALALYQEADNHSLGKLEVTEALRRASDHLRALDQWEARQSAKF